MTYSTLLPHSLPSFVMSQIETAGNTVALSANSSSVAPFKCRFLRNKTGNRVEPALRIFYSIPLDSPSNAFLIFFMGPLYTPSTPCAKVIGTKHT